MSAGLDETLLVDLLAKLLLLRIRLTKSEAADEICLPVSVCEELLYRMREEGLVEVGRSSSTLADIEFRLTSTGRNHASDAMRRNRYVGAAPVPIEDYARAAASQSANRISVKRGDLVKTFADLVIPADLLDRLGAAMSSERAVLLYGPAGSGKTFLTEQIARLLPGSIAVPHAVSVGGEIIQVFDRRVHVPLEATSPAENDAPRLAAASDRRWVQCYRPVVMTGGELTIDMLDLRHDPVLGFYHAPPHLKAMGGLFVVDDLGRQRVEPRELMNRWIVPLERGIDYLTTHTGFKFEIPFGMKVVFSTNLAPQSLADEAFLRRFGHKIHIGAVSPRDYQRMFEQACARLAVAFDLSAFEWLLAERHSKLKKPLLAAFPNDLVARVRDRASYLEVPAVLSIASLDLAWRTYFLSNLSSDVESDTYGDH